MLLGKKQGGAAVGPHEWVKDGDVVEVPDALARELLAAAPEEWFEADASNVKKARQSRTVAE
jgi:hypothetical protein